MNALSKRRRAPRSRDTLQTAQGPLSSTLNETTKRRKRARPNTEKGTLTPPSPGGPGGRGSDKSPTAAAVPLLPAFPAALLPAFRSVNSLGMRLSCVPAGEFLMGNREDTAGLATAFPQYEPERLDDLSDELPLHRVRITRPFLLGTTTVTRGEFRAFAAATGYRTQAERDGEGGWGYSPRATEFVGRSQTHSWQNPGFDQDDRHPVVNVSWHDAQAFCRWLSRLEGRRYRLPTEAEWEYACRAGSATRYHHGDDPERLPQAANIFDARCAPWFPQWEAFALRGDDGFAFTAPVGSFAPNSLGLYDMHGNVWEWCHDWYGEDYYSRAPLENPKGPATGSVRVRRGGSWHSWPLYVRSSYRNWNRPDSRYVLLGFRVAADA